MNKEHLIAFFFDVEAAYPSVHLPTLGKILSELGIPLTFPTTSF